MSLHMAGDQVRFISPSIKTKLRERVRGKKEGLGEVKYGLFTKTGTHLYSTAQEGKKKNNMSQPGKPVSFLQA